ncbi:hypothetical protein I79_017153 [Cricetulus griseus]|uniref:Uncharacterized protein n=1 Tax=Cricetulus griseus TaxID=10029 RepID=G3I1A2_CRIGR|nr:hypothetical protein I79_017153 [Cricetulus griseus]
MSAPVLGSCSVFACSEGGHQYFHHMERRACIKAVICPSWQAFSSVLFNWSGEGRSASLACPRRQDPGSNPNPNNAVAIQTGSNKITKHSFANSIWLF